MSTELALLGGHPVLAEPPPYHWPVLTDQDHRDVAAMLAAAELSYNGREGKVRELEELFLDYVGARHALAVNSGTSALHSAYFGVGIGPGDEVLVPSYTFLATVTPLFALHAVPVLIDADERTGNLDPTLLEAAVGPRTTAIAVTHLNGYPVEMDAVMSVARRHGLKVVEDCSQAHGAVCNGRKVGVIGDAAAFSLQNKKLVTAGSGGILLTNDDRVYERAVLLGHFLDRSFEAVTSAEYKPFTRTGFGFNNRIHPLGAALAVNSLRRLDDVIRARHRNAQHLSGLLADIPGVRPPVVQPHMDRIVHYGYQPLYQPQELPGVPADLFVRAVAAEGVPLVRVQSPPLHREPVFTLGIAGGGGFRGPAGRPAHRYAAGDLPASERYVARALRLPAYTEDVRPALSRFAEAFDKVSRHADALRDLARDRSDESRQRTGRHGGPVAEALEAR